MKERKKQIQTISRNGEIEIIFQNSDMNHLPIVRSSILLRVQKM